MNLGEYIGAGSATTKLLLHLNGSSADSSGNANSGTDTNITYSLANGVFGQGAGFNGTSKIVFPASASLDYAGSLTLSTWIKLTSLPASGTDMIFCSRGVGSGFGMFLRTENIAGTTLLKTSVVTTVPSVTMYTAEGSAPSTGVWYNVIGVFDNTAKTLTIYINGSQVGSPVATGETMRVGSVAATKGAIIGSYNGTSAMLDGKQDEVIFDGSVWSASKVKKYYSQSKGRFGII